MLRRRLLPYAIALACTTLGALETAHATTAVLPNGPVVPLDQRIAIAVGPSRTTVWTNLQLDTANAPVGLLVPVPPGAALDHSSDAWLEALDDATAPRVFPPTSTAYVCPGASVDPTADPFHVTAYPGPISSVAPTESKILPDVPSVLAWASINGFSLPPTALAALNSTSGMRFFVERFDPKTNPFFTSTLRVVLPSSSPVLPLTLTRSGSTNLRVTAWFIGPGRASLTGTAPLDLKTTDLQWLAASQTSNYTTTRDAQLVSAGLAASFTETSSHDALVKNIPIVNGKGMITSVVAGYFQRASTYNDGTNDATTCIANASAALNGTTNIAKACPLAKLGVVDGVGTCVEAPSGAEVAPDKLRCGGISDDLAVALSSLQPSATWLTRLTMVLPQETTGQTWPITFTTGAPEVNTQPTAQSINLAGCNGMSSSSSSSSSSSGFTSSSSGSGGATSSSGWPFPTSSSGGGGSPSTYDPSYDTSDSDMACACAGPASGPVIVDETGYGGAGGDGGDGSAGDPYYGDTSSSDDCGGSTESTDPTYSDTSSSDDCGGSTESTDPTYSDTSSSDDCGGSTESTDPTYSDTSSSDDCGGSTESTSSSESSSDDGVDCSSDTGGSGGSTDSTDVPPDSSGSIDSNSFAESGDSGSSSDCAVARHPRAKSHKRGPKASVLTLGLLAVLAPLRRLSRPRRTGREQKDKLGRAIG